MAAAETELPFAGDRWFWTDDNSKIVEFLVRPEVASRSAKQTGEIIKFLRAMCDAPFIFRRVGMPRLLLTHQSGSEVSFYHTMMHVRCDLPRGVVVAGLRFHDNRTADNLLLTANSVQFTYRGREYSVPIESRIDDVATELGSDCLRLRHSGDLHFRPGRRDVRLGRLTYLYSFDSHSMAFSVEVTFDVDPDLDVSDIELGIAHDHLSHGTNGVYYNSIHIRRPGQSVLSTTAGAPGRQIVQAPGADYYAIVQSEIAGFALGVHSAPRDPRSFAGIQILVRQPDRLHFVRALYRFPGNCRGRKLVVGEDKIITAGGFYDRIDDYSRVVRTACAMRSTGDGAIDFSVSYDYGAELNAFAQYFLLSSDGHGVVHREEVKSLFDTYLEVYINVFLGGHREHKNTLSSRQLAFVILALVAMYRGTGDNRYRNYLVELCDVMLQFEKQFDDIAGSTVSGFMMGVHSQRIVFVDCHSAAMLALTEAANYIEDVRFAAAIDRGLGCYAIETTKIDWWDGPHKIDVMSVHWIDDHGSRHSNTGFWNYHAGLTLRFFAALNKSSNTSIRAVAARNRRRIELFEHIMRWHLTRSIHLRDGMMEIRSSILSTETNSETQPWAAIGLMERGWT